jgi:hypothetical protein
MQALRVLNILIATLLIGGCDEPILEPLDSTSWLPLRIGSVDIVAQIAITDKEQQRGLMFRTELPTNSGMLFPYKEPKALSFWMKNTSIPLDIGFFDSEGILKEVHRLMPHDVTPVKSRSSELQFALEMPQGWFSQNRLFAGQPLDRALLRDALRKRGANPADYGL